MGNDVDVVDGVDSSCKLSRSGDARSDKFRVVFELGVSVISPTHRNLALSGITE